ncbi:MAG: HAD family hydrolase [Spirochaetes bacterium]|nr:HAD family hydrolase [Spirochaetota bacterium]
MLEAVIFDMDGVIVDSEPLHYAAESRIFALLAGLNRRGTKTALASSSSPELIELVLKRLGVRGLFDAVVSGDTAPRGKPAPDIYLRAAELLNARPANCIAIEDSRNGVMSAKGAGMRCVAYRNPNSPGQDLDAADMIIDDFRLLREEDLRALAGG